MGTAPKGHMERPEHIGHSLDAIEEATLRFEVERLRKEVADQAARLDRALERIDTLHNAVKMTNGSMAHGYES